MVWWSSVGNSIDIFFREYEEKILKHKKILMLDVELHTTPSKWWVVHNEQVVGWWQCKEVLKYMFRTSSGVPREKYSRMWCTKIHLKQCITISTRGRVPQQEWVHQFIHILDVILAKKYIELEVHRGTHDWDKVAQNFTATFSFEAKELVLEEALKVLRKIYLFLMIQTWLGMEYCVLHTNTCSEYKSLWNATQ